jgi:hypothetical protein
MNSNFDVENTGEQFTKLINSTYRFNVIFQENRNIFRYIFKIKSTRQFMFDKIFLNNFRNKIFTFLKSLEFFFINIMARTHLVFSIFFLHFLVESEAIKINNSLIGRYYFSVSSGDLIQLKFSKTMFLLYRRMLSQMYTIDKNAETR